MSYLSVNLLLSPRSEVKGQGSGIVGDTVQGGLSPSSTLRSQRAPPPQPTQHPSDD